MGKVTVTAVITAKYDGFKMEYATALDIIDDSSNKPEPEDPDKPDPVNPIQPDPDNPNNPNPGNPNMPGAGDSKKPVYNISNTTKTQDTKKPAVKTGDTANPVVPAVGLGAGLLLIVFAGAYLKKKK